MVPSPRGGAEPLVMSQRVGSSKLRLFMNKLPPWTGSSATASRRRFARGTLNAAHGDTGEASLNSPRVPDCDDDANTNKKFCGRAGITCLHRCTRQVKVTSQGPAGRRQQERRGSNFIEAVKCSGEGAGGWKQESLGNKKIVGKSTVSTALVS